MKKILFITHELSRTGAPIVLLNLVTELLKSNPNIKYDLLALKIGDLFNEFSEKFNTVLICNFNKSLLYKVLGKFIKIFYKKIESYDQKKLYSKIIKNNYDIIYANTIITIPEACKIKELSGGKYQIVAHIHELQTIILMYLPNFKIYVPKIDRFIAVSYLVKSELIELWGVPENRIDLIYAFTKIPRYLKLNDQNIPAQFFQVGGSGNVHWRKGHDLFIQVAQNFKKKYPHIPVHFKWIGNIDSHHRLIVEGDLRKGGLADIVTFVGEEKNPIQSFSNFDVFLMTSREDPFPLVCIEVGMLAKPIICFESATGTSEIIEQLNCGAVVPYLDTEAMADAVFNYCLDADLLKVHGTAAQIAFSQFDPVRQCKLIEGILSKMLHG